MPRGPGKYDDLATLVRAQSGARGVVVIVIDGTRGSGFSVQADREVTAGLPNLLADLIPQIRQALRTGDLDS